MAMTRQGPSAEALRREPWRVRPGKGGATRRLDRLVDLRAIGDHRECRRTTAPRSTHRSRRQSWPGCRGYGVAAGEAGRLVHGGRAVRADGRDVGLARRACPDGWERARQPGLPASLHSACRVEPRAAAVPALGGRLRSRRPSASSWPPRMLAVALYTRWSFKLLRAAIQPWRGLHRRGVGFILRRTSSRRPVACGCSL